MACPDDSTILDFVAGRLSPEAVAALDAHLDGCEDCRAVVVGMHGAAQPSPRQFGRFQIEDTLGAGAMGVVHAAFDPQLNRRVALKVIRGDAQSAAAQARLLAEAKAMARLSHPNVIPVFDVGSSDAGVFIAMELVEGETLRAWCDGASRSWREALELCVQAGRGLAAAHAAGVVHRDYKPDNVLVGGGRARVGDFGLATGSLERGHGVDVVVTHETSSRASSTTTDDGRLIGTPAYMAPEQLQGKFADARSDQFAFCVATYEAVCGVRPYAGRTIAGLLASLDAGSLVPPTREVPRRVVAVLARGLQSEPSKRFRDMPSLLAALQGTRRRVGVVVGVAGVLAASTVAAFALSGPPAETSDPCRGSADALADVWDGDRRDALTRSFAQRRPEYGTRSAEAVTAIVDGWAGRWTDAHRQTCSAHASAELDEAGFDARMLCLGGQRDELAALLEALEHADPRAVDVALGATLSLPEVGTCETPVLVEPPDPAVEADVDTLEVDLQRAWASVELGRFSEAVARLEPLRERAQGVGYPPLLAEVDLALAHAARGEGDLQRAREAALESALTAEAARHDVVVARAWTALVEVEDAAGRHTDAMLHAPKARAALERLGAHAGLEASLRNALGVALDNLGRYDEAESSLRRALALRTEQFGAGHPALAPVLTNLGNLARNRRRYEDALSLHRNAMAIDRDALGEEHPAMGRHHHNIARLLLLTGDEDGASAHYQDALRIKTATLGSKHVDVARTHNSLGLLFAAQGDDASARKHYGRALAYHKANSA